LLPSAATSTLCVVARKPDISPPRNAAGSDHGDPRTDASGRVRVLIVDDSEAVREGLSLLLNSRSYCEVVGAVEDPHSAMQVVRDAAPHVVLLDFSMPLVDPLALTARLVECRPRPAVLMLSALANEHSAARASAAGAVGWVLKDAEPDAIFRALVRAALSGDPGWEPQAALLTEVFGHAPADAVAGALDGVPDEPGEVDGAASLAQDDATAPDSATTEATKLDARTVRALLRALRAIDGDPMGATARDLAGHAVVSPRAAERILKRLLSRDPALVATADAETADDCRYVLTAAGEQELERLERHVAGEAGELDAPAVPVGCGAR
jgi:CheY-like chemotaxis protein